LSEKEPVFEYPLNEKELKIWEKIEKMQAVHNELGANLSAYKDSIIEYRNAFCNELQKKYKIEKPSLMRIDPIKRRIVSIFHPGASAHTIVDRPHAFKRVAFDCIRSSIRQLSDIYTAIEKGGENGEGKT